MQSHSHSHVHTSPTPNPHPHQRTSLPVPLSFRKLGPTTSSSASRHSTNSFLRIFVGALALAACRTWVLDHSTTKAHGGGAGWLIISLWAGKVVDQIRELIAHRKKRVKDVSRTGNEAIRSGVMDQIPLSATLALQSVCLFLALQAVGPLQIAIVAFGSSLLGVTVISDLKSLVPLIPIVLSSMLIGIQVATADDTSTLSIAALVGFAATTFLSENILRSRSSGARSTADDKWTSGVDQRTRSILISAGLAAGIVLVLYLVELVPLPVPLSPIASHKLSAYIAAILVRFVPFPFTVSAAPSSVLRLRTVRDKLIFLLAIPVLQFFALHPSPSYVDILVLLPLAVVSILAAAAPKTETVGSQWSFPTASASVTTARSTYSWMSILPAKWRPHLQTILNTPTSSRIFYFLLLNLAYMFVQMVYGVFTNSLGLISDAIHMLFDCLGLAVGLWASVAATWKPDGRYTFGYSRVETLSGFANGCFLILISVFIMFEAIQRVIDPPEMETHQLLLVSGIGLAINLWGMWATGGHHHHGHSHGHDHGHSHSHAPVPVNEKKVDHRHDNHEHHGPSDSHGASQVYTPRGDRPLAKRRSTGLLKEQYKLTASDSENSRNSSPTPNGGHAHGIGGNGHVHAKSNGLPHDHAASSDSDALLIGKLEADYMENPQHEHHDNSKDCDHNHQDDHAHSPTHGHDSHDHSHDHDHDHGHDGHSHDDHGHGHDHAHSHNMRGVFLHVLADTLGSVGVIISTILIHYTGWTGFDPIASLFIAALIMASVIPLVIDSGKVLCLDVGEEKEAEIRGALAEITTLDGISNYAAPRFWPRCEGELIGSIHIHLSQAPSYHDSNSQTGRSRQGEKIYANADKVIGRVERLLKRKIGGLTELVVQIEGGEERRFCSCMTGGAR